METRINPKMRVLSCFTGIGAYDMAMEAAGFEIAGQIEIDEFCRRALQKHWPHLKECRGKDIRNAKAEKIEEKCGKIDVIIGGSPCQRISAAGRGGGIDAGDSALFWEMFRLIQKLRPRWILIENSAVLRTRGADAIISALGKEGYSCIPLVVAIESAGAPHERKRVIVVANDNRYLGRTFDLERGRRLVETVKEHKKSKSSRLWMAGGNRPIEREVSMDERRLVRSREDSSQLKQHDMEYDPGDRLARWMLAARQFREHLAMPAGASESLEYADGAELWEQSGRSFWQNWQNQVSAFEASQGILRPFPAGQGIFQYPYEEPREIDTYDPEEQEKIKRSVLSPIHGTARNVARWHNAAIKAVGNIGCPPHTIYLLGKAILEIESLYVD